MHPRPVRHGPGDPRRLRPRQVVAHRAVGKALAPHDLPQAQLQSVLESQDLLDLAITFGQKAIPGGPSRVEPSQKWEGNLSLTLEAQRSLTVATACPSSAVPDSATDQGTSEDMLQHS